MDVHEGVEKSLVDAVVVDPNTLEEELLAGGHQGRNCSGPILSLKLVPGAGKGQLAGA